MGKQISCFIYHLVWVLDWQGLFFVCFFKALSATTIFVPTIPFKFLKENAKLCHKWLQGCRNSSLGKAWISMASQWCSLSDDTASIQLIYHQKNSTLILFIVFWKILVPYVNPHTVSGVYLTYFVLRNPKPILSHYHYLKWNISTSLR